MAGLGSPLDFSHEQVPGRQWLVGEARVCRLADGGVRVVAPAKINLTLWVGPRREDGYHEIHSIVALISLAAIWTTLWASLPSRKPNEVGTPITIGSAA